LLVTNGALNGMKTKGSTRSTSTSRHNTGPLRKSYASIPKMRISEILYNKKGADSIIALDKYR